MTRALAFSLLLLGARVARARLRQFGCLRTLPGVLPLFQNLLGSQIVLHVPTLGSPLLLPESMSQLPYLLFRGHSYLHHEQLMRERQIMSRFYATFASHFSPFAWSPQFKSGKKTIVMVTRERKLREWRVQPLRGRIAANN
jgi:hypothetical protein